MLALDAKVTIDDNALVRQPDLAALQDQFPIDPVEKRAKDAGLQYVKLDGEVGIIGNGAGLVMSTLDVVAQAGARAANFLDVGGGASADTMATSLEVILSDPAVRCVFVNIFGGITRCDVVAKGVLEALGRIEATVPIVLRLDGTNAEEGRRIIAEAAHPADRVGRHDGRGRGGGGPPGGGGRMSVLVGADTKLLVQGITGSEGTFHTLRDRAYGTNVVAGVTPGKGGRDVEGIPVFDTRGGGGRRHRREHLDDLRRAALRGRGDPGSGRRRPRPRRVHHRGDPGPGHGRGARVPEGHADRPRRPELPRRDLAGPRERRHHPRRDLFARAGRVREPVGDARVSDRPRAHDDRDRPVHVRRHGRRSGPRHRVHRGADAVRGRPRTPIW